MIGNISIVLRMEGLFALDRRGNREKSFIGQITPKNSKAENFDGLLAFHRIIAQLSFAFAVPGAQ